MNDSIIFESQVIGVVDNPVFIVGMCPGRQRKKDKTQKVWEGNQSGDLMQKIIKDKTNLFLTNIFNIYIKGPIPRDTIDDGLLVLREDIEKLRPCKMLCFGDFTFKQVSTIDFTRMVDNFCIHKFTHPSYIIRFNKNENEYIDKIKKML